MTAKEAAEALGVNLQTLYVYVGRKGIRSLPIPGTRQRRYWRVDIERLCRKGAEPAPFIQSSLADESEITFITTTDLFYRGHSVTDLAQRASFEETACLLWGADEELAFARKAPITPPLFARIDKLLVKQMDIDRATILLPILEGVDPRDFDLSPSGMARTGADVLRWLAALTVHAKGPSSDPIHHFLASHLKRPPTEADLIRRLLVLVADHGFEPATVAVRAVARAGVTPWRAVNTGLSVSVGRRSRMSGLDATDRFLQEIIEGPDAEVPVIRRLREGEPLPGFDPPLYREGEPVYEKGDPRARALLQYCNQIYDDTGYRRLKKALALVHEVRDLEPNIALVCLFIGRKLGVGSRSMLFHLGRSAGWIAHAIEQHQSGELEHRRGHYTGPLPV